MKRYILTVIMCLMAITFINVRNVNAAKNEYRIVDKNGEKVLKEYKGKKTIVKIPKGVTVIDGAFNNNKRIKRIIIPNTVKRIKADSFRDLKNLKSIKLSDNVKRIDSWAFVRCPKLKKITIPKKCKKIENYALLGCSGLEKISVKKGNKFFKVKKGALYDIDKSELIIYPRCSKQNTTFSIPESVERIYDGAFYKNKYIKNLVINGEVIDGFDEGGACDSMNSLETVVFKHEQTSEYTLSFPNCQKLKKVILADGTKYILPEQFLNCKNLVEINFPESLESIASNAFEGCDKLVLPEFDESKIREIKY